MTEFTYDPAGQRTGQRKVLGGEFPDEVETTTYDPNGNRLTTTDANGQVWQYTYDAANRLTVTQTPLSTPGDPRLLVREYDAAGRVVARTDPNGTRIGQAYNADGQLVRVDYPGGRRVQYDWTCCRLVQMTGPTARP